MNFDEFERIAAEKEKDLLRQQVQRQQLELASAAAKHDAQDVLVTELKSFLSTQKVGEEKRVNEM